MKTLTVYGASDDLIETDGIKGCDEFNIICNGPYMGKLAVRSSSGSFDVLCLYSGSWSFGIGMVDEDYDRWPEWLTVERSFGDNSPYSETLRITVPDDAVLAFERPKESY